MARLEEDKSSSAGSLTVVLDWGWGKKAKELVGRTSSTDHRAKLAFFGAPDCLERRNFSDLKRPKEATIEAVLVK
ncbi:hypothetical protein OPV22_023135 [Ensete ventricosum]|uniref:Uncharacterized protein n=1 Tax=Ensete ventricosum TaxID=4639 RepID=A0AAV8QRD2_ENSVE|nr:hypothetical protein OPV22_023135 [Ensete ventricosum]